MLLKKLDNLRKKIMPKLTENIGKSHRLKKKVRKGEGQKSFNMPTEPASRKPPTSNASFARNRGVISGL